MDTKIRNQILVALACDPRFTYAEIGEMFGFTRARAQQIATRGGAPPRPTSKPRGLANIPPEDRRRIRELGKLGMTAEEAGGLLGYRPYLIGRERAGRFRNQGGWGRDPTWRGWKWRVEYEVQLLIATDALREGATTREAAEVSGLPEGSVQSYCSTGRLPRSKWRQSGRLPGGGLRLREEDSLRVPLRGQGRAAPGPLRKEKKMNECQVPDDELLHRAVRAAGKHAYRKAPRWVHVQRVFSLGSTWSSSLCRRFDLDPDEMVGKRS